MPSPCIHCFTEAEFNVLVPEADRQIVVGIGPAFVFVGVHEEVPLGGALHRAIAEQSWLARGVIGVATDGTIAVWHDPAVADPETMNAAARHLAVQASERDADAIAWLNRLASLPDNRPEGVTHQPKFALADPAVTRVARNTAHKRARPCGTTTVAENLGRSAPQP